MRAELVRSGIDVLDEVPWGLHLSLIYETHADLIDVIVPYFAEGLAAGELCVWAPSEPAVERAAIDALRERLPDLDRQLEQRSFVFFRYEDFFKPDGRLDIDAALRQWRTWEQRAREEGFAGVRGSGNLSWVKDDSRAIAHQYERALHDFVMGRRMTILCSYPLTSTTAADVLESAREHQLVLARRGGEWDVLEVPALKRSKEHLQQLNTELELRVTQRSAQLSTANDELRREVEERRRVEAELRRSEMYLQHAQRLSHTGSFAGSMTSRETTFWSAETFRIFGLEPAPQRPSLEQRLELIHPEDRARVSAIFDELLRTGRDVEVEFRVVRPDGSIRYVRGVSTPLPNPAGRPTEFVGTLIDITEQKRATARLVQVKRAARERTLRMQFEATLEERTRLARDIHDTLLQGVTGIALKLRATLPNLGAAPSTTVESIRGIVELAEATIRDARRAVWDIRGSALSRNGLPRALEEEARRRANGVELRFMLHGEPRRIPGAFEDAIFRIGQEAVINAATHSGARSISVVLSYEPREVRLTIADDGRGFVTEPTERSNSRRWGLIGMRERAERIDAPLVIRSGEGTGTTVELSVPLAGTEDREAAGAPHLARRASSVEKVTLHASDERADSRSHG